MGATAAVKSPTLPFSHSLIRQSVLIVGGGLAGLAAATALADDFEVTLLERRKTLGGRASSFVDPETGDVVDNCQHVLMRCCTNLLDLYWRLGVDQHIRFYDTFRFIAPEGSCSVLRGSPLPAPLHFAPAFATFGLLTLRERAAVAQALWKLVSSANTPTPSLPDQGGGGNNFSALPHQGGEVEKLSSLPPCGGGLGWGETFGNWLRDNGQSQRVIDLFWSPIIVSALNEDIDRAAFRYARQVFVEGFLATRNSYQMGLPTVPLHRLYDPAHDYIRERGGTVLTSFTVEQFLFDNKCIGIHLSDDAALYADYVISAVPFDVLLRLLPDDLCAAYECFAQLSKLEYSPIVAVHLWFDREVTDLDHAALPGRTIQWMFNKTRNFETCHSERSEESQVANGEILRFAQDDNRDGQYLGLVVSAARGLIEKTRGEIIDIALRDVRDALPRAREANMTRAVVIKEPKATFSVTPESGALRPNQQTPISNFFLAGDWTNTGWPATMEGAVISGYRCADLVSQREGMSKHALQPGLVPEDIMQWLLSRAT